jgi:phosphate transport system substrate-binding protein
VTRRRGAQFWVVAFVSVWTSLGCNPRARRGLTLSGSTSLQPFAEKWADAYRARRPDLSISVQGGGSTAGIQAALSGAAEIGLSSRSLTPQEAREVVAIAVARDGIALVVHPKNPVSDLDLDQVRAIYAGRIRNWRQVGGRNAAITVISREDGSGTRAAFDTLALASTPIAASTLVQDSTGSVRQMVASDAAAVGYISIGLIDTSVKALKVRGVEASEANIDAGAYPLVRPFLFIFPAPPQGPARDFIDWILGPEGRELTRREGLLPPELAHALR